MSLPLWEDRDDKSAEKSISRGSSSLVATLSLSAYSIPRSGGIARNVRAVEVLFRSTVPFPAIVCECFLSKLASSISQKKWRPSVAMFASDGGGSSPRCVVG